jgi:hypothetical protein
MAKTRRTKRTPAPYKPGAQYMTRAQIPAYIEALHGFKPPLSSLNKLAMTGRLVPDAWFGNCSLYLPKNIERFAVELISDDKVNLRINPYSPPNAA